MLHQTKSKANFYHVSRVAMRRSFILDFCAAVDLTFDRAFYSLLTFHAILLHFVSVNGIVVSV